MRLADQSELLKLIRLMLGWEESGHFNLLEEIIGCITLNFLLSLSLCIYIYICPKEIQ